MNEFFPWLVGVAGAASSWYCYRWGHDDGRAEGHADGVADKLAADALGRPVSTDLGGGPREPA